MHVNSFSSMSSSTFAVRDPGDEPIRFAYWVPNVSGGLVISNIEQRTSWDIDYNRKLAQTAENNGFDYALSQIRFTAGYGAEYQHEPVLFSHANKSRNGLCTLRPLESTSS